MHQDAHEFLNYLLNTISETLDKQASMLAQLARPGSSGPKTEPSWIQVLFEGSITNQTKCKTCGTVCIDFVFRLCTSLILSNGQVTLRTEPFLDLSLDIDNCKTLKDCLTHFSKKELMEGANQFFCDTCKGLSDAEKRYFRRFKSSNLIHIVIAA